MVNELNDMEKLAIKGHPTRGKEVIEILEMLGGKNTTNLHGECGNMIYIINSSYYGEIIYMLYRTDGYVVFTLEEFLEKFPYKVGDKVQHKGATSCGSVYEVEKMRWEEDTVKYTLRLFGCIYKSSTLPAEYLQPYKEEIIDTGCCSMPTKSPMYKLNIKEQKDTNKVIFETNSQCCDISNKTIKKETMEKEISGAIVDRFICLEGYDFYDDKGNIIDTKEITMKKKQPKYPKTYEECCKVLQMPKDESYIDIDVPLSYNKVLTLFTQLLICRDAYWKIAGEQMGLGKSWKPNWSIYEHKFCLGTDKDKIIEECVTTGNRIIAFPTKEIRDAFYENFKELIEECKELL